MEKLPEAEALREKFSEVVALCVEYLDLMKTMYATCLMGLDKAKAHMVGTQFGFLVTQSAKTENWNKRFGSGIQTFGRSVLKTSNRPRSSPGFACSPTSCKAQLP